MKKVISVLLAIILVFSLVPLSALNSTAASGTISLDTNVSVRCSSAGDWDVRTFTPSEDGVYIFSSSGSLDTLGYIALAEGEAQNEDMADDGGQGDNFAVTFRMTAGTTYYLGSTVITGATGTYTVKVVRFQNIDDDTIKPISAGSSATVNLNQEGGMRFYSFKPSVSGRYVFNSSGSYDITGYIFDDYWRQIAYASDGGTAQNFKITADLQSGVTYYLGCSTSSINAVQFNILVTLSSALRSVSVSSPPEKTEYIIGLDAIRNSAGKYDVNLSLTGFAFKVVYANGESDTKVYGRANLRGFNCNTATALNSGANAVPFNYMGVSSSFNITVSANNVTSVTIDQMPEKVVYYDEDATTDLSGNRVFYIRLYGMVLKLNMNDGSTRTVNITSEYGEDVEYLYFDYVANSMALGMNRFSFTFYGKQVTFDVKYALNSSNYEYEVIDNSYVRLTKYLNTTDVEAIIPDSLGGYPVTEIGNSCFYNNSVIKYVRMTDNITSVNEKAFYGCSNLRSLDLPKSLSSVGNQAFFGLVLVNSLNWNAENLSYARELNVFGKLGTSTPGAALTFGYDCSSIPADAFYMSSTSYNANITKITVGENVNSIGANAFRECNSLKEVEWNALNITGTVTAANNIWYNCAKDASFNVTVGEYVESVPRYLFYSSSSARCPRVGNVYMGSKNTVINENSFRPNSAILTTFYCWYDNDDSVYSMYDYCVDGELYYVLLDSPLENIFIYSSAAKTEYLAGEQLDLTGLVVYAVYEDGTQINITDELEVSGFDSNTPGVQTVTLTYTFIDKSDSVSYEVLVVEEQLILSGIKISSAPNKTDYYTGESLDTGGIAVTASYTNGFTRDVTNMCIFSEPDMSCAGEKTVTVTYTESGVTASDEFVITVNAVNLTKITVSSLPDKTQYNIGEELNLDGAVITASYSDGGTKDVTPFCEFLGFDSSSAGSKTVFVSYTENGSTVMSSFGVTVNAPVLTGITVTTPPTVTEYTLGDSFSADGMVITASYSDGSSKFVNDYLVSGYDMSKAGTQLVTVTYTENGVDKTAQFNIRVINPVIVSIKATYVPTAVQYQYKDLITDGLSVAAIYNNGTSRTLEESEYTLSGYDKTVSGSQTLLVTHNETGLTDSFALSVTPRVPTGIVITSVPDKTVYNCLEEFVSDGLTASVTSNNGDTLALTADSLEFSGYDMNRAGRQTVYASYTENGTTVSATFNITVNNYETGITVTSLPDKTAYVINESFDSEGLEVTAHMADGSDRVLDSAAYTLSGFSSGTKGEKTVTVSFTNAHGTVLTDKFTVTVGMWLTGLEITAQPQTQFYYNDAFNYDGLGVRVHYADGTYADVSGAVILSGYAMNNCSVQTVTVTYNEKGESVNAEYEITVNNYALSIYIKHSPNIITYYQGESLNTDGIIVTARMADATEKEVTDSCEYDPIEGLATGVKAVKAYYLGEKGEVLSAPFNVIIKATVESLQIISPPDKTEYALGQELDLSGLSVVANMTDGKQKAVTVSASDVTGFDPNKTGEQVLTVTYTYNGTTVSATFTVTVMPEVETLELISPPDKTGYIFGEELDLSGLSVVANMSDGTRRPVSLTKANITGFNSSEEGVQTLTASYTYNGKTVTAQFTVTVEGDISRCDVNKDGTVDVADASLILMGDNYAKTYTEANEERCDVNRDTTVDVSDVAQVLLSTNYGKNSIYGS